MEKRNDIFTELYELSPLLAGLDKVTVFSVPDGYFDTISATVLACVTNNETVESDTVPAGYFDTLAGSILSRIKAETVNEATTEINDLSPLLAGYLQHNVFTVPEGYFENLSGNIIESTEEKLSSMMTAYRQHNVYKVPNGYFETLSDNILARTTDSLSPLMSEYREYNVYTVPAGYFEGLADSILQKVQPPVARVVTMSRRNNWLKYAAAAMIAGVMLLGVYKYTNQPAGTGPTAYVDPKTKVTVDTKLDPSIEKGIAMNDQQFNEALDNLSEDVIAQYLDKNGSIADVALLTSASEDKNLQSTEETDMNEQLLEKYLNEIELVN